MRWRRWIAALVIYALISAVALSAVPAEAPADPQPKVIFQDEQAAFEADAALLTDETGLPEATVERVMSFQEASAAFFEELLVRYPDQISGVWVDPLPATTGHVAFVGEVPPEARMEAEERGLDIVFTTGTEIPLELQRIRSEIAAQALAENGIKGFATSFDQSEQVIEIELQIPQDTVPPDLSEIVEIVRPAVAADGRLHGRAAELRPSDVKLTVTESPIPPVTPEYRKQIEGSPLAIWDASLTMVFLMSASGEGALEITDRCVWLRHDNGSAMLLVWPAPTRWDAETRTIHFVDVEGNQIDLREGDRLIAGGAAAFGKTPYVKPPDASCRPDSIFVLHSIELNP